MIRNSKKSIGLSDKIRMQRDSKEILLEGSAWPSEVWFPDY